MPTNAKETKGAGKVLINALGFISFLVGSLILLAIVFGMMGGIFMSTKRLFQVKRVKGVGPNRVWYKLTKYVKPQKEAKTNGN